MLRHRVFLMVMVGDCDYLLNVTKDVLRSFYGDLHLLLSLSS